MKNRITNAVGGKSSLLKNLPKVDMKKNVLVNRGLMKRNPISVIDPSPKNLPLLFKKTRRKSDGSSTPHYRGYEDPDIYDDPRIWQYKPHFLSAKEGMLDIVYSDETNATMNMAIEEYIYDHNNLANPIIFIYRNDKSVVVGRN